MIVNNRLEVAFRVLRIADACSLAHRHRASAIADSEI